MAPYAKTEQLHQRLRNALARLGTAPRTREELATLLGVSIPTAVRAIVDLRARGYNIVSVPLEAGRGWHYELREHPDRRAGAMRILPSPVRPPDTATLRKLARLERGHHGKIAAIEPTSGDIFIADSVVAAARKARRKHPHGTFYFKRVGEKAVHGWVGGMRRVPHGR